MTGDDVVVLGHGAIFHFISHLGQSAAWAAPRHQAITNNSTINVVGSSDFSSLHADDTKWETEGQASAHHTAIPDFFGHLASDIARAAPGKKGIGDIVATPTKSVLPFTHGGD